MAFARSAAGRDENDFAMSTATETIEGFVKQEYKYGFVTDVETESAPPGVLAVIASGTAR